MNSTMPPKIIGSIHFESLSTASKIATIQKHPAPITVTKPAAYSSARMVILKYLHNPSLERDAAGAVVFTFSVVIKSLWFLVWRCPPHRSVRRSMKRTFCAIFLFGLPLLALAGAPLTYCESFGSSDDDSKTYCWVLCGQRDDRVAFVVFQNTHGTNTDYSQHIHLTLHSTNTPAGTANVGEGWIDMPDGTKRDLPTSKMVFEYTDGVFHSAPIDMSYDDLTSFIQSGHTNSWGPFEGLTVDNLKRYEKKLKTESSNQTVQRTGASRSAQETNRTSSAAGSRR